MNQILVVDEETQAPRRAQHARPFQGESDLTPRACAATLPSRYRHRRQAMQQVYLKAKAVRLAIFDVDGVLTDGGLHYSDSGEETKVFDVRDGLRHEDAAGERRRARDHHEPHARAASSAAPRTSASSSSSRASETSSTRFRRSPLRSGSNRVACAYMGDDWVDLPVLMRCGLALSVPEAPAAVRERVHYVTRARRRSRRGARSLRAHHAGAGHVRSQLAAFLI